MSNEQAKNSTTKKSFSMTHKIIEAIYKVSSSSAQINLDIMS